MALKSTERNPEASGKRSYEPKWRKCGICGKHVAFGEGALRWYGAGGLVHSSELPADAILANGQRISEIS